MPKLLLFSCYICHYQWYSGLDDSPFCSKCGHSFLDQTEVEPPIRLSPTTMGSTQSFIVDFGLPNKPLTCYHLGVIQLIHDRFQYISHNDRGNELAYNVVAAARSKGLPLARLGFDAPPGVPMKFVEVANVRPL